MNEAQKVLTQYLELLSRCCKGNGPEGFHYKGGPADLLLQHGRWYRVSRNRRVVDWRGERKQCFYNAATAATRFGLEYVEGIATNIIPVHHAWCAKNGVAYEVTWPEAGSAYFGIPFSPKDVINLKERMSQSVLFNPERSTAIYEKPFKA